MDIQQHPALFMALTYFSSHKIALKDDDNQRNEKSFAGLAFRWMCFFEYNVSMIMVKDEPEAQNKDTTPNSNYAVNWK